MHNFFEQSFAELAHGVWHGEHPDGFYRSLTPGHPYHLAPFGTTEHFQEIRKIEELMKGGPPPNSFRFVMQKKMLLPGAKLSVWGDLHGSAHSLCRGVKEFVSRGSWKLKEENRYLVCVF